MGINVKRALLRFFIFAAGGLLGEVFYGASLNLWHGNLNMHGNSSIWMIPDYGLFGLILMYLARPMIRWGIPLAGRAFVYMLVTYFVEYTTGMFFTHCLGLQIWSYNGIPYNLHGQIMLYSAPIWYALGLCAEYLYRKVDAVALFLLMGAPVEILAAHRDKE